MPKSRGCLNGGGANFACRVGADEGARHKVVVLPAGTVEAIPHVPLPNTDPLYGAHGPLTSLWRP
jgi:uncharacterized protein YjlB